ERGFGRMEQLKDRQVTHGLLGMEAYFAAEGLFSYVAPTWGPQNLRCLLGRVSSMSIVANQTSGIRKLQDLKAKRLARVSGAMALSFRLDALIEAAGLTGNDLTIVEFNSGAEALAAVLKGEVDCAAAIPTSPTARVLEAAADTIVWIE